VNYPVLGINGASKVSIVAVAIIAAEVIKAEFLRGTSFS
jgi:hypothetical protein